MNATFLVTLNVQSEEMIPQTAEDIDDDLLQAGHDVIEVKPWARPTLGMESTSTLGGESIPPIQPMF